MIVHGLPVAIAEIPVPGGEGKVIAKLLLVALATVYTWSFPVPSSPPDVNST